MRAAEFRTKRTDKVATYATFARQTGRVPTWRLARNALLSSVALCAILSAPAGASCTTQTGGLERVCTGTIDSNDAFDPTVSGTEDISYYFRDLTSTAYTNSSSTENAITFAPRRTPTTAPGTTLFNFNADKNTNITITSETLPVVDYYEFADSGGGGHSTKGSGKRSGGSGGTGGYTGFFNSQVEQLTAVVPSSTPTGLPATLKFFKEAGNGGNGGSGESTGFGDGYGGSGGAGGSNEGMDLLIWHTEVAGSTANGQPNPNGGIDVSVVGGTGGTGGEGRAADYTGGGGAGGTGGAGTLPGQTTLLTLTGDTTNTIVSQTYGVNLSSVGGAAGNGGEGKNTLSSRGNGGSGGTGGYGGDVTFTGDGAETYFDVVDGPALFVQSLAGKGGTGGEGDSSSGTATGGDGGKGGTGGTVTVQNTATTQSIITTGDTATGIHARSHGGAGGDGGSADGNAFKKGKGGASSGSGPGGEVSVTFGGHISTDGASSDAVLAHSVGGYAGDAGNATGFSSYGGSAESAGGGGEVSVTFNGASDHTITTIGANSDGIFAQSVGGGGGKGGSASGLTALAGSGSAGGSGGTVTVTTTGNEINTQGDRSRGIVAQSLGGGGGDGGGARALASIGGSGSGGGAGGSVTVTSGAPIVTSGDDSIGLLAQSVGGGGGNGSSTGGLSAIGGAGGNGATGGPVTVTASTGVTTTGQTAPALFAQSAGGSGGHGSHVYSIGVGFNQSISGAGGSGQTGGTVTVKNSTPVTLATSGINSPALHAQSVGGGGGNAGNEWAATAGVGVGIDIGKSGGGAGAGGAVDVTYLGSLSTKGDNSTGLIATSTGGGGGSAGSSISGSVSAVSVGVSVGGNGGGGGAGEAVTVCRGLGDQGGALAACAGSSTAGSITTEGASSPGLLAASHGGGGGHSNATITAAEALLAANVTLGGDGGAGGAGGAVNVLSTGGITTTQDASPGLIAKSVGGSGGAAYMAGSVGGWQGTTVGVTVGGSGGSGKGSGAVTVVSEDAISTSGDLSDGIKVLSQAGGGGLGAIAIAGTGFGGISANVDVGGPGGGGGVGGDVSLDWTADTLSTTGTSSPGITVQSSGGSGGIGGTAIGGGASLFQSTVSIGGKGGSGGTAGTATVATDGAIATSGSYSDGVYAVSQGGNGGRGGGAITGSASIGDVGVTLGAAGGGGGTGQEVAVTTSGSIDTDGANSVGIYAVSQGGNGGRGGFAIEESLNTNFGSDDVPAGNVSVTLGGDGGTGGTADAVTVTNGADITTTDLNSAGVSAQSIAGNGGTGGMAYTGTVNVDASTSLDVTVSVGGGGGDGGTAGDVTATNTATITTGGANSDAIFAQSIGGNGGNGGASYTTLANLYSNSDAALNFGVTVGGGGGQGGAPGTVNATSSGTITTSGTSSSGLYLQSIGGNGGKGGSGGTAIMTFGDKDSDASTQVSGGLTVTVGGSGGTGAVANKVNATHQTGGSITTNGGGAYGIFAQSIGGHGGDGGLASTYTFAYTGACDLVGTGYLCKATEEDDPEDQTTTYSMSLAATVGGSGGSGNDGNEVTVENHGIVETNGDVSHGIFAQSIGAGGGVGGAATDDLSAFTSNKTANQIADVLDDLTNSNLTTLTSFSAWMTLNFFLGGQGGAGGDGSAVDISGTSGTITTTGTNSYGILAQSIGGGGGAGGQASEAGDSHTLSVGGSGSAAGAGGDINVTGGTQITTSGYGAAGILAQTIGGGGGDGGSRGQRLPVDPLLVNVQIGGSNGASGNGGAIYLKFDEKTSTGTNYSFIETKSTQAPGMLLQSIGGGGGSALGGTKGPAKQNSITVGGPDDPDDNPPSGDGGSIFADQQGNIDTATSLTDDTVNAASHGIVAQSIGGGGGYGGALVMGSPDRFGTNPQDASTKGKLPSGDGGAVDVILTGQLVTKGANSVGIFAQSVGGGGGVQGNTDNTSTDGAYIGNFGGTGVAGTVTVNGTPGTNITTSGPGAHGIFAQYAGGTDVDLEAGGVDDEDVVHVIVDNTRVKANGDGAYGIFTGATGSGFGSILIDIEDSRSTVSGGGIGTGTDALHGAGIYVKGGSSAQINNAGTITSTLGSSGVATIADAAFLTISNAAGGTVIGSTLTKNGGTTNVPGADVFFSGLSDAQSAPATIELYNLAGGRVETGLVHQTSVFQNEGQVFVGPEEALWDTTIEGPYTQLASGVTEFDFQISSSATDTLTIEGDAAIAGQIRMAPLAQGTVGPSGQSAQLIVASGRLDTTELTLTPSIAGQYSLEQSAPNSLGFSYDVDFRNATILNIVNDNQDGLSQHLHEVHLAGALDGTLARDLLLISDEATYTRAMNDIGAELYVDGALTNLHANQRFTESLMSCAESSSRETYTAEGRCGWISLGGRRFDRDASSDNLGFQSNTFQFAGGLEHILENGWTIGGALSFEDHSLTVDNSSASSTGEQYQGGVSAKRTYGPWEFGGALSLSYGKLSNSRTTYLSDEVETDQDVWTATGLARASWTQRFEQSQIKPWVGFGASTLWRDEVEEAPPSGYALVLPSERDNFFFVDAGVEADNEREIEGLGSLKASIRASVTQFLGGHDVTSSARLASAPGSVSSFEASTDVDPTQFAIDAGLDLFTDENVVLRAEVGGTFSENTVIYGASFRGEIRF